MTCQHSFRRGRGRADLQIPLRNRTELHAATPIVCPPDRCSGIAPNHAKMAEMLEMLPALLRQDFLSNIVVLFEDSIVQIRTKSIAHIIRRLEEKSEPYDSSRLQELSDFIADEMHSFCSGVVLSSIGNSIAFNALRGVFKNIVSRKAIHSVDEADSILCTVGYSFVYDPTISRAVSLRSLTSRRIAAHVPQQRSHGGGETRSNRLRRDARAADLTRRSSR